MNGLGCLAVSHVCRLPATCAGLPNEVTKCFVIRCEDIQLSARTSHTDSANPIDQSTFCFFNNKEEEEAEEE